MGSEMCIRDRHIIRGKQQEASAYEKAAKDHISAALLEAKVYVAGEVSPIKSSSVKDKIEAALSGLVESVYAKLGYVKHNFDSDAELLQILSNQNKQMTMGSNMAVYNPEAVDEVEQFLSLQNVKLLPTSMGDIQRRFSAIPYGWREIDIAAAVCTLIALRKVGLQYCGSMILATDKHIPDYLRRKNEIDKSIVSFKHVYPPELIKKAREIIKEYFNTMDVPSDGDDLVEHVIESFTEERDTLQKMLDTDYTTGNYPDRAVVENGIKLCNELFSHKKDGIALLKKLVSIEDDLLDLAEDMADVYAFFKNQKPVFDSAAALHSAMNAEREYLQMEKEAVQSLYEIQKILLSSKPYKLISNLPNLIHTVQQAYQSLMNLKRQEVFAELSAALDEIRQTAKADQQDVVDMADKAFGDKSDAANAAKSLTALDAMKIQIANLRQQYLKALMKTEQPEADVVSTSRAGLCHTAKLENEADIDRYVADIKAKLMSALGDHDVLHII